LQTREHLRGTPSVPAPLRDALLILYKLYLHSNSTLRKATQKAQKSFSPHWQPEASDMILVHYAPMYEREGVDNNLPPFRLPPAISESVHAAIHHLNSNAESVEQPKEYASD